MSVTTNPVPPSPNLGARLRNAAAGTVGRTFDAAARGLSALPQNFSQLVRQNVVGAETARLENVRREAEEARQISLLQWEAYGSSWIAFFKNFSMSTVIVLVTLGVLALVTFVYLNLEPTVFLPNSEFAGQCPDRWIFREDEYAGGNEVGGNSTPLPNRNPNPSLPGLPTLLSTKVVGKCWPTYQTTCQPFDPSLYTKTRCDIAKSCGTTWTGVCKT
jgi:hypothetical protein